MCICPLLCPGQQGYVRRNVMNWISGLFTLILASRRNVMNWISGLFKLMLVSRRNVMNLVMDKWPVQIDACILRYCFVCVCVYVCM